MMTDRERLLICQALTGSSAKIMIAFCMAGMALDVKGLVKWTTFERHTVDVHLKQLEDLGLVVKQTLAHRRNVWLPAGNFLPGFNNTSSNVIQADDVPQIPAGKNTPTVVATPEDPAERARFESCLIECDAQGIREPKRTKLSKMAHVTPEKIRSHCNKVKVEGDEIGTAIYRIEYDWAIDEQYLNCDLHASVGSKYVTGQFADYIEH